jgi:dynein intermediate chain 2
LLVGTEQGTVLLVKRKAKGPNDRVGAVYPGHHGPIYALARHSMFSKVFLTVGDWTARIWNDEIRTPIMTTKYHASYLTDGCWSPTRPGVFFTTKMDGTVDIWDYFFKQGEPTLTLQVTDMPLHCLRCEEKGCLLATGAADGSTTLFEISNGLYATQPGEKQAISLMLDRESKREKNLEVRQKEAKLAAKKAEALAVQAAKGADGAETEEQRLLEVEREFFEIISASAEHKARSGSDSF